MKIKIAQGIIALVLHDGSTRTSTFDGEARRNYEYRGPFWSRRVVYGEPIIRSGKENARYYLKNLESTKLIEYDDGFLKFDDVKEFHIEKGSETEIQVQDYDNTW